MESRPVAQPPGDGGRDRKGLARVAGLGAAAGPARRARASILFLLERDPGLTMLPASAPAPSARRAGNGGEVCGGPAVEMTPALFFLPKVKAFGGTYVLVQSKGSARARKDTPPR